MRTDVLNVITTRNRNGDKRSLLTEMTGTSWEMYTSTDQGTDRYTSVHGPFILHLERYPQGSFARTEENLEWKAEVRTVLGPLPNLVRHGAVGSDPLEVFREVWEAFRDTIPPGAVSE